MAVDSVDIICAVIFGLFVLFEGITQIILALKVKK